MDLIVNLKTRIARWRYVYGWRARHWWFDTQAGLHARLTALALAFLATVASVVRVVIVEAAPVTPSHPRESIIGVIIYLIVALIIALVLVLTAPKPSNAAPQNTDSPTVQDGQSAKHVFGEVWIGDEFLLGWKIVGRDPIKASGGK